MTFRCILYTILICISNLKYLRTNNMQDDNDTIETEEKTETISLAKFHTVFINIITPETKTTLAKTTPTTFEEVTVLVTTTEMTTWITVAPTIPVDGHTLEENENEDDGDDEGEEDEAEDEGPNEDEYAQTLPNTTNLPSKKEEQQKRGSANKDYSMVSIKPSSPEQLNEILAFELVRQDYLFWSHRRVLNSPLTVVLPPNETNMIMILREHRVDYNIVLEEFQKPSKQDADVEVSPSLVAISFNQYLRYEFIMNYLIYLTKKYPEAARLIHIGKTVEDRNVTVIEIKDSNSSSHKIGSILVEAGMHAREWLGVSVALYTIHELVEHAAANEEMLHGLVWYVLPVLNADGYEYSHTIDRYWKNNRRTYRNCCGVDLDRNFFNKIKYRRSQVEKYVCTNLYPGEKALSEPETRALVNFIKSQKDIKAYFSLHSGETFVAYPWAYKEKKTTESEDVAKLATEIKAAIESKDNTSEFAIGRLNLLCGQYDGAAIDWAKDHGIDFPLMISFKGNTSQNFDVTEDNLFDTVVASVEGIRVAPKFLRRPQKIILAIKKDVHTRSNSGECKHLSVYAMICLILRFFL